MANTFGNSGHVGLMLPVGVDAGVATKALVLDSNFILGTSGDAIGIRFCSPVTQVNGALLFYAMPDDNAGAPTYIATLHDSAIAGGTPSIPKAGAVLATSDTLTDPADDTWPVFTFANVSLTAGSFYWLIIQNTHATPASNYGSWYTRGAADAHALGAVQYLTPLSAYTSADGFQTGTLSASGIAPVVIKFNDNSVMGFPYIVAGAAHASNTNYRGNRLTIPGSVICNGLFLNGGVAAMNFVGIGDGAAAAVVSKTVDECGEDYGAYFEPTTLVAATAYDYVMGFGAASTTGTIYAMIIAGQEANVPADVLAAAPCTYVDGAGLDSLTNTPSMILGYQVIAFQDVPAASGGGLIRHPGMSGGLNA